MGTYLEVTGHGTASQAPDRLDLHLSLTAVRDGVADALAHVNGLVAEVGAAVRDHGLADDDVQTTSSTVSEEYGGPESRRTGYRASQDLRLRVAEPAGLATLLAAVVAVAGDDLRMNHLAWGLADDTALAAAARGAAFDDARAKAEQLARLAGSTLGKIRQVVEDGSAGGGVPRFAMARTDSAGFAPERGLCQVEVSLTVRWGLDR